MSKAYGPQDIINAIYGASKLLGEKKDEVNRLNVFPVPDGDTGTNMSLTLESVVSRLSELPPNADSTTIRKAITTGALMGARGNSGVITSQIFRGLCDGFGDYTELTTASLDAAFAEADKVAFKAVRKPVEGTILTVLEDVTKAAHQAHLDEKPIDDALQTITDAAYVSVERTPELLPVLKENNVVDSGAYGLAVLIDGFSTTIRGETEATGDHLSFVDQAKPKVQIEHIRDWAHPNFTYCNEFLVHSTTLVASDALDFLSTLGDCELVVGDIPDFKVHVHSNHPDQVLKYFLDRGSISEVYIHNMQLQADDRNEDLKQFEGKDASSGADSADPKAIGVVAVAAGAGNANILKSLGVDEIVQGGQTMNPSTKDLLEAVERCNAKAVIILPNNKNIVLAAQSCAELAEVPTAVVPTRSVPQGFSAMFGFDESQSLKDNVSSMEAACADTQTGEITKAIKDAQSADGVAIHEGDIIGIADGVIKAVGSDIDDVTMKLIGEMDTDTKDTLTILAGAEEKDDDFNSLVAQIQKAYPDLEVDPHRGDQPLYPLVFSIE